MDAVDRFGGDRRVATGQLPAISPLTAGSEGAHLRSYDSGRVPTTPIPEASRAPAQPLTGRRPRVLLAWEHGRNFGRLSRLLTVAHIMEEQGGEPVWVVPRGHLDAPELRELPHRRFAVPAMEQQRFAPHFRANSFADVLMSVGFEDAGKLLASVKAWVKLIEAIGPESVVLDYAPMAQLAVALMGLRAFQLTNGFDAPPADCPMFAHVQPDSALAQRNAHKAEHVSMTIAQVGRAYAGRSDCSIESVLQYPQKVFECIPETDPYGPRRDGLWIGPLGQPADMTYEPWPEASKHSRRVFAHLRTLPGATDLLDELRESDVATLCVWRDAPAEVIERYRNSPIRIVRHGVALERVLPGVDAVLNHGSTTLVCRTLLAGKPQLMLPTDFEKLKVAEQVVKNGAGVIWHQEDSSARQAIDQLMNQPSRAERARSIAAQYPPALLLAQRNRFARDMIGYVALEGLPAFEL